VEKGLAHSISNKWQGQDDLKACQAPIRQPLVGGRCLPPLFQ
jgi:hypothetical protein